MQHSKDANDAWFTGSDTTGMPGREQWSAGLRLHMEKQCAMWANITASIEHNVDALGTANMKLYSPEERAALAIMMGNMEQLLGQVEDEPGPRTEERRVGKEFGRPCRSRVS